MTSPASLTNAPANDHVIDVTLTHSCLPPVTLAELDILLAHAGDLIAELAAANDNAPPSEEAP